MSATPDFSPEVIAEALRAATPGPWVAESYHRIYTEDRQRRVLRDEQLDDADAHLIANAPTWLAQLLAALEAERVAHAETRREAGELRAERTELFSGSIDRTMNELRRLLAEARAENEWLSVARSDLALAKQDLATAEAALEAKDGEVERAERACVNAARDSMEALRLLTEVAESDSSAAALLKARKSLREWAPVAALAPSTPEDT